MSSQPAAPARIDHVAIVGAGFAGTLQAINLLRHDGPRVTLIERRAEIARGVAYSTPNPAHLLNVRAANMSALPDDPTHFVRWLAARSATGAQGFASRRDYGDYLADLLEATRRAAPERLVVRRADATGIAMRDDGVEIGFARGAPLAADATVLALGNLPPHDPPHVAPDMLSADIYAADPWASDVAQGLTDADTVLIVGTGLTMVDVVLTLDAAGFGGCIVALSRRGLTPHAHADGPPPPPLAERPTGTASAIARQVRAHAAAIGWRAAVDALRPHTQRMWLAAPPDEQRRFIRHLRAWWDIHRHRLAPAVAARLSALRESGRLRIVAGRLDGCTAAAAGLEVRYTPRGASAAVRLPVRRLVNCTGPQGDLPRTREPLLRALLASGLIRPDPHRLGIDVDAQAQTIRADGRADPRLYAIGPMTRGAFWEIVAVPDIRRQVWTVARRLANAQWVEGEGL